MAKYRLLADGYNITFTNYSDALQLADTEAEGSGSLKFVLVDTSGDSESACGLTDLPALGSKLSSLQAYNGDGEAIVYNHIRAINVGIEPLLSSNPNKPTYTVQYSSEGLVANKIMDFSSNLQVVSFENPIGWRYGDIINAQDNTAPTGINGAPAGSVQQRLSRTVVQGSFKVNKVVHPTQMGVFFEDYQTIAGKLNTELVTIYTGSLVQFNRGTVLCSTLSSGQYIGSLISFGVSFEFRFINDKTAVSKTDIIFDDWQYVLAPKVAGEGGWMIPVRTTTADGVTLTSNPYLYPYATEGLFNTFIAQEYSTPI